MIRAPRASSREARAPLAAGHAAVFIDNKQKKRAAITTQGEKKKKKRRKKTKKKKKNGGEKRDQPLQDGSGQIKGQIKPSKEMYLLSKYEVFLCNNY